VVLSASVSFHAPHMSSQVEELGEADCVRGHMSRKLQNKVFRAIVALFPAYQHPERTYKIPAAFASKNW
jgi:hypothetical protein